MAPDEALLEAAPGVRLTMFETFSTVTIVPKQATLPVQVKFGLAAFPLAMNTACVNEAPLFACPSLVQPEVAVVMLALLLMEITASRMPHPDG